MEKRFQGRLLRIRQSAAVAVIAVTCLTAAYYTLRIAYAEYLFRSGAPEKIDRAAALVPLRAEYQARARQLERAVRLNPYFSAAWIELGLRAEAEGDFPKAEAALLEAARIDKTFEPNWALANFYFRRSRWTDFWKWIHSAARMSYGDRTALFSLCWRTGKSADEILAKAMPPVPAVLGDYVDYLARMNQFEAGESAALRLIALAPNTDPVPRLLAFSDTLLEKTHGAAGALRIWNGAIGRGWLPYQPLDPDAGASLTNGDFATSPQSHGFDWRILRPPGIRTIWTESPRGLFLSLDGKQTESAEILEQWLPLRPSSTYELSVSAESSDIPKDSGLRWRIIDASSGADLSGPGLDGMGGVLPFSTGTQSSLAKLTLRYQRPLGASRLEGRLRVLSASLAPAKKAN